MVAQVYITFPQAFWQNDNSTSGRQSFTGFAHWLSPAYAFDTNPLRWEQQCIELSSLPSLHAHPTLLFYIYGDQAISLSSALITLSTQEEKDKYITNVFRPYFSLLPQYAEGSIECTPSSCLMTNWSADELAGCGSYSNFPTKLEEGDVDIKVMREGLPGRSLWFAGEHVAPFMAMGTVNGAYGT